MQIKESVMKVLTTSMTAEAYAWASSMRQSTLIIIVEILSHVSESHTSSDSSFARCINDYVLEVSEVDHHAAILPSTAKASIGIYPSLRVSKSTQDNYYNSCIKEIKNRKLFGSQRLILSLMGMVIRILTATALGLDFHIILPSTYNSICDLLICGRNHNDRRRIDKTKVEGLRILREVRRGWEEDWNIVGGKTILKSSR